MKKVFLFMIVFAVLGLLTACSAQSTTAIQPSSQAQSVELPNLNIKASDFAYELPKSTVAGWVKVTLTNSGAEPHHVQLMRLNDGVTLQQFQEALSQGEGPAMALVKQMGGVGAVAPGGSASAILNLTPGEYVVICFIPSPADHAPHFVKGMITTLTVESSNNAVSEPSSVLTVKLKDFSFDLPESLPFGEVMVKVVNEGPEPHELNLLKLADGKTAQDVLQYLQDPQGPPPFMPVGGMNGLDVNQVGYLPLNLSPGNYVAICNIPSPKAEGHPHFTLGMVKEFTVK